MFFDLSARPELADTAQTLAAVADVLSSRELPWFVIGAAARDLVLTYGYGQALMRATRDLDLAVAVPTWEVFEDVAADLVSRAGFTRDGQMAQRFRGDAAVVDIVPFGELASGSVIAWPPR